MATQTFDAIGSVTFTGQTTVVMGSIPQSYRHLFITITGQASTTSNALLRMNGDDTAGNYNVARFYNIGFLGSDQNTSSGMEIGNTYADQGQAQVDLFDYTSTNHWKPALIKNNWGGATFFQVDQWKSTDPVSSITFVTTGGTFSGTITIYGLHG